MFKMKKNLSFLLIPITVLFLYYPALFTYFSQDDFFHFKVSLTNGSLTQFINLFGFHPFTERGIAFYRPLFREGPFNIFYSLFGLNSYPFRILQFLLLFLNSALVYYLLLKILNNNRNLSLFTAFFYAISSAQVSPLYYLAGGVQVLGATTFLLLTLILVPKRPSLSFFTFLLGLASHELASIIPFLIMFLFFILYPFKKALRRIWQIIPFFLTLFVYLYLEITKIGFSNAEKQYQMVLSLKGAANAYMWYFGWALGLPEMLIDFVFPGFRLNSSLMKYWGNYYIIIFSTFFVSLFLLSLGLVYIVLKRKEIILNKKVFFFLFWFLISLFPVILLPLHKSTQYLETGLPAFWMLIGFIIFGSYQLFAKLNKKTARLYLFTLIFFLFSLSATSAILQRTTYWAAERGKLAKQLIDQLTSAYPTLPKGAVVYFKNDPAYPFVAKDWGGTSKQASIVLNGNDAIQLLYKDPTIQAFYEDLSTPSQKTTLRSVYTFVVRIN